jgi:hypothetical protein
MILYASMTWYFIQSMSRSSVHQQLGRKIPDILYEIKFLIVTKHNKVLVSVNCAIVELKSNVSETITDVEWSANVHSIYICLSNRTLSSLLAS